MFVYINYLLILGLFGGVSSFVAYDCTHPRINTTTLSLLQVADCDQHIKNVNITNEDIYMLQLSETHQTTVTQCVVQITQVITGCGMHSHAWIVDGGFDQYFKDISMDQCYKMQETGYYDTGSSIIGDLKQNSTTTINIVHAGSLESDGTCEGVIYKYGSRLWKKVVVQHLYKITLKQYDAIVNINDNKIMLEDGVTCNYLHGSCLNRDQGNVYWKTITDKPCLELKYDVLYHGYAERALFNTNDEIPTTKTVYSVNHGEIIFAMTIIRETNVCTSIGYQTEHARIVIVPSKHIGYSKINTLKPTNVDLFAYINSKFVYTEKHIKNQMGNLYEQLMISKCLLEREVLYTQLSIATVNPNEFAYLHMKSPGYTAIIMGDTINIIQCQSVEVSLRKTNKCYNELPVTYNNKTMFRTSKHHLLTSIGTEVECNDFLRPLHKIMGKWYSIHPNKIQVHSPEVMHPTSQHNWVYIDPESLSTSGIYTVNELDSFRKQIMYPSEKQHILSTISRTLYDNTADRQNLNFDALISENTIDKIMKSYWKKLWGVFSFIGETMSGIIGIYALYMLIKFLLETIIHAYSLYPLYGWSWRLVAACWGSLAYCLTNRTSQSQNEPSSSLPEHIILVQPNNNVMKPIP